MEPPSTHKGGERQARSIQILNTASPLGSEMTETAHKMKIAFNCAPLRRGVYFAQIIDPPSLLSAL